MAKIVFISYCHKQAEWVRQSLVPCLEAGGAQVLIDYQKFQAGRTLIGQMNATQDSANLSVLVLSPAYLDSANCMHEMQRAIARDPQFQEGAVVAVKRVHCAIPANLEKALYVDLCDDQNADEWERLLHACEANLGTRAPAWLKTRDEIVHSLQRDLSVNFVVPRKLAGSNPNWRKLIEHIKKDYLNNLGIIDLQSGSCAARQGLVAEMLRASGAEVSVPNEPKDLVILTQEIEKRLNAARLVLTHFDMVAHRPSYGIDLFAALRNLMEKRKLTLLIHSRSPFVELLPAGNPLSSMADLTTIELHGWP